MNLETLESIKPGFAEPFNPQEAIKGAPNGNEGIVYAIRFEEALTSLLEEGKIDAFRATRQNSREDQKGIDYWITAEGQNIPFQITGHTRGRKPAARKRTARHEEEGVFLITVRSRNRKRPGLKSVETLKEGILRRLEERKLAKAS